MIGTCTIPSTGSQLDSAQHIFVCIGGDEYGMSEPERDNEICFVRCAVFRVYRDACVPERLCLCGV